jgi:hypothetical protein
MKYCKAYALFIIINIFFSFNAFAVNKAVYPDSKLLRPVSDEIKSGAHENMNLEQAQIIKNNLDETSQTLDAQKLEENVKAKDNKIINSVSKQSSVIWITILFMVIILFGIMGFRFFKKDE